MSKNLKGVMNMDKFCIDDLCVNIPERQQLNSSCVDSLPLAMAYVPMQKWRDIYDIDVGFSRGTIFKELDLPFLGKQGIRR